jgi:hypothetical protein
MRVSVYLLRHKGERRPLDDVRASTPAVGSIRVTREPGGRLGTWQRGAFLLVGAELSEPVLQLHNIQLQSWDERGPSSQAQSTSTTARTAPLTGKRG